MTVQVRPTPARTWGNSIKPFRAVKPGPQLPTYTLKTWKPPVPEPLPPAPLLGLPSLLALGALVLSQLWGLFAGRQEGRIPGPDKVYVNNTGDRIEITPTAVTSYLDGSDPWIRVGQSIQLDAGSEYTIPGDVETYITVTQIPPHDDPIPSFAPRLTVKRTDGSTYQQTLILYGSNLFTLTIFEPGSFRSRYGYQSTVTSFSVTTDAGNGLPTPAEDRGRPSLPSINPEPAPVPFPWITPEELAAIRPVPLPLPDGEPLADPANPQPQTTPLTVPAPLVAPTVPLLRPLPAGVQLLPGGTLPTPQAAAVPQTPQGTHYPATGLAIPANSPAPTLKGIAQEVGRVESKLNKLLNPASDNNFDRLELIYDTISGLFDFLTSITAGGSYTLEAPCETAEDGSPLVVEHTYDGALNSIGVLSNKIDALAAMLQTVKNQKQPVCKAPPRQGQAVTVNFEEV